MQKYKNKRHDFFILLGNKSHSFPPFPSGHSPYLEKSETSLLFSATGVPLTVDKVVEAVDTVKRRWRRLGEELGIPSSGYKLKHSNIKERLRSTIHLWLRSDPYASWRRIIQALDGIKEHEMADKLHHLAEPIAGMFIGCTNKK